MRNPVHPHMLARSVALAGLAQDELATLASKMRVKRYRRGEVIFHHGDPADAMHVVIAGHAKVSVPSETGDETVLTMLGPGALFGEIALLDGGARSATVIAVEPSETATLHRSDLFTLLVANERALQAVLSNVAGIVRRLTDNLADVTVLDVPGRLAKKLLELADAHGEAKGGAIVLRVPVTQSVLAGMIGATRASVNKALGGFERAGLIARDGRQVSVLRRDLLAARGGASIA